MTARKRKRNSAAATATPATMAYGTKRRGRKASGPITRVGRRATKAKVGKAIAKGTAAAAGWGRDRADPTATSKQRLA